MNIQRWTVTALLSSGLVMALPGLAEEEHHEAAPLYVRTLTVVEPAPTLTRQFFGRIAARDTMDLAFEVGGRLTTLDAPEGRIVKAGSVLAELDLSDFERRMHRAELDLAQAERDLARARTLAARNVASAVAAQDAETARDLAEIALRDARDDLGEASIVAPFDGLIADRIASAHTIVEPGAPIVRIHDMSEIRVEFDLPERLLRQAGDLDQVAYSALKPGETTPFDLEFREFRAETGAIGQSYKLSLAVSSNAITGLLPGQTVLVHASIANPDPMPSVPATAVATRPDGSQIVVAVEPASTGYVARHIPVELSARQGSIFTALGLPVGTEIVAVGAHAVADGAAVTRYPGLIAEAE